MQHSSFPCFKQGRSKEKDWKPPHPERAVFPRLTRSWRGKNFHEQRRNSEESRKDHAAFIFPELRWNSVGKNQENDSILQHQSFGNSGEIAAIFPNEAAMKRRKDFQMKWRWSGETTPRLPQGFFQVGEEMARKLNHPADSSFFREQRRNSGETRGDEARAWIVQKAASFEPSRKHEAIIFVNAYICISQ